jgi:putative membrane protein
MVEMKFILSAGIFSALGIVMLVIGFFIIDKLTPYALWKEIVEHKNMALAILVGSAILGISNIIASAIH